MITHAHHISTIDVDGETRKVYLCPSCAEYAQASGQDRDLSNLVESCSLGARCNDCDCQLADDASDDGYTIREGNGGWQLFAPDGDPVGAPHDSFDAAAGHLADCVSEDAAPR